MKKRYTNRCLAMSKLITYLPAKKIPYLGNNSQCPFGHGT